MKIPTPRGVTLPRLYVLLLPLATVTTLLAANPYEGVVLVDLRAPAITALSVAALAWFLAGQFIGDRELRSLMSTVAALLPLLSGYLFGWLRVSGLPTGPRAALEIGLLVLVGALTLRVLRRIQDHKQVGSFLSVFALLVIALSVPSLLRATGSPEVRVENQTLLPDTIGLPRPDIYLIVLDAYSGQHSLSSVYGFDNTPFLDSLRARGFEIPDTSRSNYVKTFLSIGSMLNREYYDRLTPPAAEVPDRDVYHQKMERNRTVVDLKRLGYSFHYAGSSYPPLSTNRLADEQYSLRPSKEFHRIYFRSTVLRPILELCAAYGECGPADLPFQPETADETERRIAYMLSRVEQPGPKFVYAHWLLPHGPYRFGADCAPVASRWTIGNESVEDDSTARRLYLDQVQCTNAQLLRVVDEIRRYQGSGAVIILQSDHGHGRFPADVPSRLSLASRDQVTERFDVFAAYAGPAKLADSLAESRTPVNAMRTLFRLLWGVDEAPVPDRYFWSEGEQPLFLVELKADQVAVPPTTSPPSR